MNRILIPYSRSLTLLLPPASRTEPAPGTASRAAFLNSPQPAASRDGLIVIPTHSAPSEPLLRALESIPAALLFVCVDWNRDLSPWPAKAVFPGEDDFAGRADDLLAELTGCILPLAEQALPSPPQYRALAGYSLAGLFCVYAAFRTAAFTRIASVSGSMWYDGFLSFAGQTPLAAPVERAWFSVGAKEKRTRNPRMASVEDNTRAMERLFRSRGAGTRFTLHPGNHFADTEARMAEALAFLAGE